MAHDSVRPKSGSSPALPTARAGVPAHAQPQPQPAMDVFTIDGEHPQWFLMLPQVLQSRLFAASESALLTTTPKPHAPVEAMLQGAQIMAGVVADQFHLAVRRGQTIGTEIEFLSNVSRTDVTQAIAARYQAAGYHTREVATPYYVFGDHPQGFWETLHQFTLGDRDFGFHLYEGMGGFVVTAKAPFGIQADILSTKDEAIAFERGCALLAEHLQVPIDQVRQAALAGNRNYLLALKSEGKDYFQVKVELHPTGTATLTPLTGTFLDAHGEPEPFREIVADSLQDVKDYLVLTFRGKQVPKTDPVTTIEVEVPGRAEPLTVDVRFDVYPIHEVVTSPMAAGERQQLTTPLLDFLHQPGKTAAGNPIQLAGTEGVNQVGFQVHREVPLLNAKGEPTVEYALRLHREWIQIADPLSAIVPTTESRKLFAGPLPPIVASVLMDPHFVTDPTDVIQALDYFGLVVRNTRPKYHALNPENWFAAYIKVLFERGILQEGDILPSKQYDDVTYYVGADNVTMAHSQGGDTRYEPLIRIPSSHPIATFELRTPDTDLTPDYMNFAMDFMAGFGHDEVGTASREVAAFYNHIQQPGLESIARDFAKHPGLALSIATLLGYNVPDLLIAHRLKGLVGEAAMAAIAPYKTVAADPVVASVVDTIRVGGLTAVLGPDAQKDPIAQGLDNLLTAGKELAALISHTYDDAEIPSQFLGVEVEGKPSVPRDQMYQIVADAYRALPGVTVDLVEGAQHFNFTPKSPRHWTISQSITVNGIPMVAKVASGTGGFIISAIETTDKAKTRDAKATDVLGALHEAVGLVTEFAGSSTAVAASANPHYLMMCKAADNDYLSIDVQLGNGQATLKALNGQFNGPTGLTREINFPAHDLNDVDRFLAKNARTQFALKDNVIARMEAHYPGHDKPFVITFVAEEYPNEEAVTSRINARRTDVTRPYLDALSGTTTSEGKTVPLMDGMRSGNPLAFHVHAQLPHLDPSGRMTVAAFLQLQRNFAAMADSFSAILGPDANRVGFAKKAPDPYLQRIADPNYAKDPANLLTILNVFGDYVAARRAKYQDFSAEHFTSWFLRTLINQGELKIGQTLTTEWHGETVQFAARQETDGSAQIYRGVKTDGGFTAEQPMIRLSAHQPTAELRLPNALFAPNGGTTRYVEWLLKLTTSLVQTHAQLDSRTIAPSAIGSVEGIARLLENRIEAPARPTAPPVAMGLQVPAAQRGAATLDGMANVATLGAKAIVEKLATLNAHVTGTVTSIARGGATFLVGDIGSDLVLGDWKRLKNLSLANAAKDYALLTAGGEPTRMLVGSLADKLPIPAAFKTFVTRASSLIGALTAQQYGHTGTINTAQLPESVASIMTASALVQGSVMAMGQMESLSHLGRVLRLAKVGGGVSGIGLVVTSVAEFALIKTFGKMMEDRDEAHRLTALTASIGKIVADAAAAPAALAEDQAVSPVTIATLRAQLDDVIAAMEHSLTLEERRVWASYHQNVADLKDWYAAKMAKSLDGTFSYGEIEDTYRTRQAVLVKTRDQDLAALMIKYPKFVRLPVDPSDDWTAIADAIDEDQLKADVDMDGNAYASDTTAARFQVLLDRNPHVLAAQLQQFRADWEASLKRRARPMPEPGLFQQILAQR